VAKVTRDRYIENWVHPEYAARRASPPEGQDGEQGDEDDEAEGVGRGSGYPSDPKTQAYLKDSLDPVFGYKGIVRFSWATVKVLLDKQGVECKWQVRIFTLLVQNLNFRQREGRNQLAYERLVGPTTTPSRRRRAGLARMRIMDGLRCGEILGWEGLASCSGTSPSIFLLYIFVE
jgi:hypothetical protein